ncbi:MAG: CoA pyrophosphatase [Planctomycetota bacterium]
MGLSDADPGADPRGALEGPGALEGLAALERLARALRARPQRRVRLPGVRRAGVLVPLFVREGELQAWFTRRREDLAHHAGQVSFPGGRLEPGEEPLAAALREAEEEVGLSPASVRPLGALSELLVGVSGFVMSPWVGEVPADAPLTANPAEVARVFSVPLRQLVDPARTRYTRRPKLLRGVTYTIPYFEWEDELIWGATGKVLVELLEALGWSEALAAAEAD